jgi:hypothetical protein
MRRCLALALLLAPILWAGWLLSGPSLPLGIDGRVVGPGGPLAGARVRLQATGTVAVTDAGGRFRLPHADPARHVTAWKDGFLIGGMRAGVSPLTLRLAPLPDDDHPEYRWIDSAPDPAGSHNCANCHADIYREWSASGHARSVTGSYFRNLYEGTDAHGTPGVSWGLLKEYPEGAGVCSSCHAPAVPEGDSSYLDLRHVEGTALKGVHCDYCHKVAGPAGGAVGLTHGRFGLRTVRPAEGQLFFGPLDDVDRGEDAYSPFYRESRYCASCHEGVVFGVHVYSTYSEWLDSPARRRGKQCQDCHMTPTGKMTNIAPGHGGLERAPRTLASHRFFDGGRAAMLRRSLQAGATLEPAAGRTNVRVRLTADGAGHRVPTGFVDRHLLLVVEGEDAAGRRLEPRSGPTLPAAAGPELAGRPGRLYAKHLRDFDGRGPVPFWLAAPGADDNRLTPGRPDDLELTFPPDLARVRVRVLYRRFWHQVAAAKGWPDTDLVVLERAFDGAPSVP